MIIPLIGMTKVQFYFRNEVPQLFSWKLSPDIQYTIIVTAAHGF